MPGGKTKGGGKPGGSGGGVKPSGMRDGKAGAKASGKDGAKSSAGTAGAAAGSLSGAGSGGGKKREKGHRQKGAGTEVKSKGEREVDGMVLKEWQRTPVQLLHEFTQSTKRRGPKYAKLSRRAGDPPGFRTRVIVPDAKKPGTDKDLIFIPVQACKTESDAKQSVALLALAHLQTAFPHEKRLPTPYAAKWLACVAAVTESTAAASARAKPAKASAVVTGPGGATKGPELDAAAAPARPAATAAGAFSSSWDAPDHAAPASSGAGGSGDAALAITLQGQHTSIAARKHHKLEKEHHRRSQQNQREARRALDPNKPMQVFMAEDMRAFARAQLSAIPRSDPEPAEGALSAEELEELIGGVMTRLVDMGFSPERVEEGVEAEAARLSALGTEEGAEMESAVALVLDWLCLHVPETELPTLFNPRGRNLEVLRPAARGGPKEELLACGFHAADVMSVLHACNGDEWAASAKLLARAVEAVSGGAEVRAVAGSGQLEWPLRSADDARDAEEAAELLGEEREGLGFVYERATWTSGVRIDAASDAAESGSGAAASAGAGASPFVIADVLNVPIGHGCSFKAAVVVSPCAAASGSRRFAAVYPATSPLLMVRCTGPSTAPCEALPEERLAAAVSAAEAAITGLGEPCLSAVIDAAEARLDELVASRAPTAAQGGRGSGRGRGRQRSRSSQAGAGAAASSSRLARPLLRLGSPLAAVPSSRTGAPSASASAPPASLSAGRGGAGASGGRGRQRDGRDAGPAGVTTVRPVPASRLEQFRALDATMKRRQDGSGLSADTGGRLRRMQAARDLLPIAAYRKTIVDTIAANQVTVLRGETGCGKSTQLPQFVLEEAISQGRGGRTHIVVTQPRRLAALGLASRVAAERCESVARGGRGGGPSEHSAVGYHIRGERRADATTSIVFCTTGILLRQLQSGLDGAVTHVVVDEVHERSVDADFLLAVLRRVIVARRDVKLVLMSATVDAGKFQDYFSAKGRPCPVIEVPGFVHPVREVYLDEILGMTAYVPSKRMLASTVSAPTDAAASSATASACAGMAVDPKAWHSSRGDLAVIAHLVCAIASGAGVAAPPPDRRRKPAALPSDRGTVLVFLPGVPEIRNVGYLLRDHAPSWGVSSALHVVELHGGLAGKDQAAVFENPPAGKVKVVLATNVAETSVTIDGVTEVIDGGRVKMTQYDAPNRMSKLEEMWTALDSADQRRGRAGRTRPGVCYRVYPEDMKRLLPAHSEPEIRRVALEGLCLQIRLLGLGRIRTFLGACLDPPDEGHIASALTQLQDMGAILPSATEDEFELCPLGRHIARLPMDVRLAKCLVFGAILRCLDPVLTVTAALAGRTPLVAPPDKRADAAAAHAAFARGQSDHMRLVAVYRGFADAGGYSARKSFCAANFLSFTRMMEIDDLRREYATTLASLGFLRGTGGGRHGELAPEVNVCSHKPAIVRSALVAGLYPNIVKVVYPQTMYADTAGGKVAIAAESRTLRFYTLADTSDPAVRRAVTESVAERAALRAGGGAAAGAASRPRPSVTVFDGHPQQRVFLHPQSVCFAEGKFSCPWLVYSDKAETSKAYIRDATVAPAYALLLFGGKLETLHEKGLIAVGGGWIRFTAVAGIAVIMGRLREELDRLLAHKISNPEAAIHDSPAVDVILELLEGGGARLHG